MELLLLKSASKIIEMLTNIFIIFFNMPHIMMSLAPSVYGLGGLGYLAFFSNVSHGGFGKNRTGRVIQDFWGFRNPGREEQKYLCTGVGQLKDVSSRLVLGRNLSRN